MSKTFEIKKDSFDMRIDINNTFNPSEHTINEDEERTIIYTIYINDILLGKSVGLKELSKISNKKEDEGIYVLKFYVSGEYVIDENLPKDLKAKLKKYRNDIIFFSISKEIVDYHKSCLKENYKKGERYIAELKENFDKLENDEGEFYVTCFITHDFMAVYSKYEHISDFKELVKLYDDGFIKCKDVGRLASIDKTDGLMPSSYSYIINKGAVLELIELGKQNVIKSEDEAKEAEERANAKITALIEKAKTEGPQVVSHYTTECNDPNEDCDFDTIYTFVDGEGTYTTRRCHNW